jgi:hypothetical protein
MNPPGPSITGVHPTTVVATAAAWAVTISSTGTLRKHSKLSNVVDVLAQAGIIERKDVQRPWPSEGRSNRLVPIVPDSKIW